MLRPPAPLLVAAALALLGGGCRSRAAFSPTDATVNDPSATDGGATDPGDAATAPGAPCGYFGDTPLRTLGWSADGRTIVAGGWESGTVSVFDAPGVRLRRRFGTSTTWNMAVALSPDGTRVAVGSGDQTGVRIFRVSDGGLLAELATSWPVYWLAFSPDGEHLASTSGLSNATFAVTWRLADGAVELHIPGEGINGIAFTPDGAAVVTAASSGAVTKTSLSDGAVIWQEDNKLGAWGLAVSPDGTLVAAGLFGPPGTIVLVDAKTGITRRTIQDAGGDSVTSVAFSPDSRLLASAVKYHGAAVWRVDDGTLVSTFGHGTSGIVGSVVFSPDGTMVAGTGIDSNPLLVVRAEDGSTFASRPGYTANDRLALSADGLRLATRDESDRLVHVWSLPNEGSVAEIGSRGDAGVSSGVGGLAISADGSLVASALGVAQKGDSVGVWRVKDGALLTTVGTFDETPAILTFSPDASLLAVGADRLTIWHVDGSGIDRDLAPAGPWSLLRFSPDGAQLAAVDTGGRLALWNLAAGSPAPVPPATAARIRTFAFAPAGTHLLIATDDHTLRLWTLADATSPWTVTRDQMVPWAVAFSPDGARFAVSWYAADARSPTAPPPDIEIRSADGALLRTIDGGAVDLVWTTNGTLVAAGVVGTVYCDP